MSWAKWAFVPKFDYTTGDYNGFWQEADVNFFIDTIKGSDSNAGTAAAPFKTLSKVKSLGTSYWKAGVVIFVNGRLNETCDINVAARIVGVGGDNGRCVFDGTSAIFIKNTVGGVLFDNVKTINYTTSVVFSSMCASNCIFNSVSFAYGHSFYFYNVSFYGSAVNGSGGVVSIYGRNNTLYNVTTNVSAGIAITGTNSFCNNIAFNQNANQLINTNARYFTDNTETTPAQLLIDPANGNFNFKKTVYIWDKTAQAYITTNPLFEKGTFNTLTQKYNHIGAGYESNSYNGLNSIFIDSSQGGTATYNNIQVDGSGYLSRINDGIDGVLTSGIGYLGKIVKGVTILLPHTFTTSKRIIKTTPSVRVIQDIEFRWGASESAVNTADWCLIEYGKPVYYSLNGTTRIGNADPLFDIANALFAEFPYFQFRIYHKNI